MTSLLARRSERRSVPAGAQGSPGGADYCDVDLAMVVESTYPYLLGGLSAVVHDIVMANPDRSIGIIHIAWDSHSPNEEAYPVPDHVKWIRPVYLSMQEHAEDFTELAPSALGLSGAGRRQLVNELFDALDHLLAGNMAPIWRLYDRGMNPRTRHQPIWALLGTREFMEAATDRFSGLGLSFAKTFWQMREYFSLACATLGEDYPRAKVYHSHTTGYAGLVAAAAARQNAGRFLLTEHNLYTRDTINTMLDRDLSTVVTSRDWQADQSLAPDQRSWMAWYTEMGRLTYAAADSFTYLYPKAIPEAAGLGSVVERAQVVPNGMVLTKFDGARARFLERRAATSAAGNNDPWRLLYCARLVPIKGLINLVNAVAELRTRGVSDFTLDVLGHADEIPEYAEACRRRSHELGLDDQVSFVGNKKMADVLGEFDVLVLPSYNEGQPMVVLEAMTVGLPVIGTRVGGMEQLVLDPLGGEGAGMDPCGVLVEPGDSHVLADAIEQLLGAPSSYEAFSASSRRRLVQYFQLSNAMSAYRNIYEGLELPPAPVDDGGSDHASAA